MGLSQEEFDRRIRLATLVFVILELIGFAIGLALWYLNDKTGPHLPATFWDFTITWMAIMLFGSAIICTRIVFYGPGSLKE